MNQQNSELRESFEEKQNEIKQLKTTIKRTQISDLMNEKEEYYLEVWYIELLS